jgi:hypothetical protein
MTTAPLIASGTSSSEMSSTTRLMSCSFQRRSV